MLAIEKSCVDAREKLVKLDGKRYKGVIEKLDYVLGSYRFDKNPVGLYEMAGLALDHLKGHKKENSRKVSKKLIEDIQKSIARK